MSASKEYYLKLSEQVYNKLSMDERLYLNHLGMQVKQLPTEEDLNDENYKKVRSNRIEAFNKEQEYLFKKRNS